MAHDDMAVWESTVKLVKFACRMTTQLPVYFYVWKLNFLKGPNVRNAHISHQRLDTNTNNLNADYCVLRFRYSSNVFKVMHSERRRSAWMNRRTWMEEIKFYDSDLDKNMSGRNDKLSESECGMSFGQQQSTNGETKKNRIKCAQTVELCVCVSVFCHSHIPYRYLICWIALLLFWWNVNENEKIKLKMYKNSVKPKWWWAERASNELKCLSFCNNTINQVCFYCFNATKLTLWFIQFFIN